MGYLILDSKTWDFQIWSRLNFLNNWPQNLRQKKQQLKYHINIDIKRSGAFNLSRSPLRSCYIVTGVNLCKIQFITSVKGYKNLLNWSVYMYFVVFVQIVQNLTIIRGMYHITDLPIPYSLSRFFSIYIYIFCLNMKFNEMLLFGLRWLFHWHEEAGEWLCFLAQPNEGGRHAYITKIIVLCFEKSIIFTIIMVRNSTKPRQWMSTLTHSVSVFYYLTFH